METKKLGFGLMRLPVRSADPTDIDLQQMEQMVDEFLTAGFTYFDTSYVYHNGASEGAIRRALVERPGTAIRWPPSCLRLSSPMRHR